ncbi:MAG TPA: quinone-dependent dihydroorotate dehydrogenase [Candidatus Pelagibacter sp.]|nr:quinone-dependent dihydroorotate dehydrogenase [Candidatus Pelagibacter sp.]
MFSKLRSLIFKLEPELAHSLAIKALKFGYIPPFKQENNELLKTNIFGKNITNLIGMAAGFDKDAEVYNSLFKLGYGFVEVGTVTPLKQYGNPKPRMFRLEEDKALINRLGFNSSGAESVCSRIKNNPPKSLLGINIGPNKDTFNRINDYLIGLRTFYNLADYLTINISSPNTENLRSFHNQQELENLISAIDKEKKVLKTKIPTTIKISPDINGNQIDQIAEVFLNYNIPAIIISNTTENNRDSLVNSNKYQKGGLSGKPLEEKSNLLIKKFYKIFQGKIKIIGVGGVDSGKSVYEKLLCGANLIQLYTGMVYEGPNIVNKIIEELNGILKKEGISDLNNIIGSKS